MVEDASKVLIYMHVILNAIYCAF